jgi:hypothetical protein
VRPRVQIPGPRPVFEFQNRRFGAGESPVHGVGTQFHPVMTGVGGAVDMMIEFTAFERPRLIKETTHLSNMDITENCSLSPCLRARE